MTRDTAGGAGTRGITLVEAVISSAILLMLSTLFFAAAIPALQREEWFQDKQTNISGSLVARERLFELLSSCLLVPEPDRSVIPGPDILLLEFYKPDQVQTDSFSGLAAIDLREAVIYDRTLRYRIILKPDGKLIETDQNSSYRKLIWNLGEGASVTSTQAADLRRVDFEMSGYLKRNTYQEVAWTKGMVFRLR